MTHTERLGSTPWVGGVGLLTCLLGGCGTPTRTTPLRGLRATPIHSATEPQGVESSHRVTLRHEAAGPVLVSRDARWLVRSVAIEPGGRGWLVDDLSRPDATPMLVGVGGELTDATFLGAGRLLTFDAAVQEAVVYTLESGGVARARCRVLPAASPGIGELGTIDAEGHFVLLDPSSLVVRWRLVAPTIAKGVQKLDVAYVPSGLAIVSHDGGAFIVDPVAHAVRFQGDAFPIAVSHGGRYGVVYTADYVGEGTVLSRLAIIDFVGGATIHSRKMRGWGRPVAAFSSDERIGVYSLSASEVTVVNLPSGSPQRVPTGLAPDTEHATYVTDQLALTEEGHFVCGHVTNTAGADGQCQSAVYADTRLGRSGRGLGACLIDGDTAYLVPPASKFEREGRQQVPSSYARSANRCSSALSPDHAMLGIITARSTVRQRVEQLLDAEVNLMDVATAEVVQRFPLGSGLGQRLDMGFSPSGRWLQVAFDERVVTFDTRLGTALNPPPVQWVGLYDAAEARGVLVLHDADAVLVTAPPGGTTRRFPHAIGSFCLSRERLSPASDCRDPRSSDPAG